MIVWEGHFHGWRHIDVGEWDAHKLRRGCVRADPHVECLLVTCRRRLGVVRRRLERVAGVTVLYGFAVGDEEWWVAGGPRGRGAPCLVVTGDLVAVRRELAWFDWPWWRRKLYG